MRSFVLIAAFSLVWPGVPAWAAPPPTDGGPDLAQSLALAEEFRQSQDFERALVHYIRAAQLSPGEREAIHGQAQCYARTGHLDMARRLLGNYIIEHPDDAQTVRELARVSAEAGVHEITQSILDEALKRFPGNVELLLLRAANLARAGRPDAAEQAYQAIGGGPRQNLEVALGIIEARRLKGDLAGAMEKCELALADFAHNARAQAVVWTRYGEVQIQKREYTGARRKFERALRKEKDFLPALFGLADLALTVGNKAEAQEHYREILAVDADNFAAKAKLRLMEGGPAEPATSPEAAPARPDGSD